LGDANIEDGTIDRIAGFEKPVRCWRENFQDRDDYIVNVAIVINDANVLRLAYIRL